MSEDYTVAMETKKAILLRRTCDANHTNTHWYHTCPCWSAASPTAQRCEFVVTEMAERAKKPGQSLGRTPSGGCGGAGGLGGWRPEPLGALSSTE